MNKNEKLLDYIPGNKNAEPVVWSYGDCHMEPYNETPVAALPT